MRSPAIRIFGALALLGFAPARMAAAQTEDDFFNPNVLHEIRLEIHPNDWNTLKTNFQTNDYYPCNFAWRYQGRDVLVENVGIRSRGTGSRSDIKPGLRVDFDRNEEKQRFLGLKSVVLRNNTQDPSMLHERLSMLLMRRMGLYASRVAHARLYVNDVYIGLYGIVETVDKAFLAKNLGEDTGYLYKYDYNASDPPYYFGYRGSNPALYSPSPFKPETHEPANEQNPAPLEAMVRAINQSSDADFVRSVSEYLDLKQFMRHIAVERYVAEQDGVVGGFGMNNFYLYRYANRNLHVLIAWDKSNAFLGSAGESIWRFATDVPESQQNVLMRRALRVPELRAIHLETLAACARLAGGSGGLFEREVDFEYNQIRTAAREDPNKRCLGADGNQKPCTNEEFEADVVFLRSFARERSASVLRQVQEALLPFNERTFSLTDRGGFTLQTVGSGNATVVGYTRIRPDSGQTTPGGLAIFGFRQGGVLVSEAGVPASRLVQSGRIYAEVAPPVNTGVAIANPNSSEVTIEYYYTDAAGQPGASGRTTIPANGQIAEFLDQPRFNPGASFTNGSFTFTASAPVSVIALRGLNNERGEFLITTLPVAELQSSTEPVIFSHFAEGGGWTTQVVLVNPTDEVLTGTVQFTGPGGAPVSVTIDGQTASSFTYTIPARSAKRLQTAGVGGSVQSGAVRVTPSGNSKAPTGLAIFAFRSAGVTVSEAGVPAARASQAFRLYGEVAFDLSILTGVAVANPGGSAATVTFEVTELWGKSAGPTGTLTVPANGQAALFLNQVPGLESLPLPFRGIVRISTSSGSGVTVVGLRGRVNERGDFLITTTPPVDERITAGSAEQLFPQIADSGGYTTQFILYSGASGQSTSGVVRFVTQSGQVLNLLLW